MVEAGDDPSLENGRREKKIEAAVRPVSRRAHIIRGMSSIDQDALLEAARRGREKAVATYSGFRVGAALLTAEGETIEGCNVENASYGLTMCAERVALYAAISRGLREFSAIAVVTQTDEPSTPCGPCRQLLWEFCGDIPVFLGSATSKRVEKMSTAALLPKPFDLERP